MRMLQIPGTSASVSRLSFGTGSLHRLFSANAQRKLLQHAIELGFTHFDCSPYYGFGLAEKVLGGVLADARAQVTVASKVGIYPRWYGASSCKVLFLKSLGKVVRHCVTPRISFSISLAADSMKASLSRLKRDVLDILFLHEPPNDIDFCAEISAWARAEVQTGNIRAWGIAGDFDKLSNWLGIPEPFVLQVRDSTVQQADLQYLPEAVSFVLTFSCLSGGPPGISKTELLINAANKNKEGSIIISSGNLDHLRQVAEVGRRL